MQKKQKQNYIIYYAAAKRKLVEATRNCYIDRCRQVPRKPWIKGDFTHIDKIFIDPSLVKRNNSGNEGHEATYRGL